MSHLLKAMGFWIWGLIVIGLSVSLVSVNYRMLPLFSRHDTSITSKSVPTAPSLNATTESSPSDRYTPHPSPQNVTSKSREISGIVAKEMAAAQNAPQASQWLEADSGAANGDAMAVMSQIFYLQKDCRNSTLWADKAIAATRKTGDSPKENLYQFKLQCASDAGDNASMATILMDLIKLTNKAQYWNTLLRIERQEERDDHNLLMIYRIMYDTSSMTAGSDYIEMAQLLGDAALPGEAQMVIEKATAAGLFADQKDRDRAARLTASLRPRAEADKKDAAKFDAEAAKNPTGELDVKLGEVYFGFGDYQNAVTAINRGLQKGGIKHLDEAYVYLGLSRAALRDDAAAQEALDQLKTVPSINRRMVDLWQLYAETHL
jgi:hypothetical protein